MQEKSVRTYTQRARNLPDITSPSHQQHPIYAGIVTDSCFRLFELSRATAAAFSR